MKQGDNKTPCSSSSSTAAFNSDDKTAYRSGDRTTHDNGGRATRTSSDMAMRGNAGQRNSHPCARNAFRSHPYASHSSRSKSPSLRQKRSRHSTRAARASKRRKIRSSKRHYITLAIALAAIICIAASSRTLPKTATVADELGQNTQTYVSAINNSNMSTPKSVWEKGEMPYLYQIDDAWANTNYAGSTIEKAGCGPTALSMVYIELTGKRDLGPKKMARWSEGHDYVEAGATRWTLMSEGAQYLGLRVEELEGNSVQEVEERLDANQPVICIMGPGDFTDSGHFIVLWKNKGQDTVEIRDPNSPTNSRKYWELSLILSQCRCLWAYSEA